MICVIPIRIESTQNLRECWQLRARRAKSHRELATWALGINAVRPALPCVITLTRIAPRSLDSDNLASGCKAARDGIADWLRVDDGDKRIEWRYVQVRGAPKQYALRIDIKEQTSA